MVLGILHDGGCVWDLKWHPSRGDTSSPPSMLENQAATEEFGIRLGILAVSLGDGSVQILAVPHPGYTSAFHTDVDLLASDAALFIKSSTIEVARLRMAGTNITRLQWSPHPPNSLLLTGCDNGTLPSSIFLARAVTQFLL